MPDDCPVRSQQELLLREGESYVHDHSGGGSTFGDPLNQILPDYHERETDFLRVPLTTASDILAAEQQAKYLEGKGQLLLAKKVRERIKVASKELFGPKVDHRALTCISTAERLRKTAWGLEKCNNLPLSEKSYRGVVELYRTELGEGLYAANALGDLARLLNEQGKTKESKLLYSEAVAIYDKHPEVADPDMASVLESYAGLLQDDNSDAPAAALYKRAGVARQRAYAKRSEYSEPDSVSPVPPVPHTRPGRPIPAGFGPSILNNKLGGLSPAFKIGIASDMTEDVTTVRVG